LNDPNIKWERGMPVDDKVKTQWVLMIEPERLSGWPPRLN
jgi:hypothetical protein